jgi:hypothetical protein
MRVRRNGKPELAPATSAALDRVYAAEIAKDTGQPQTSDRVVLFGGPSRLVEIAAKLANDRDPPPEHLACNPADYRAAGLHRNGPITYLGILPKPPSLSFVADVLASALSFRKTSLEPHPDCPLGEVRVIS